MKLELLDGLYIPNPAYWGFDGGESADWRGGRCRPVQRRHRSSGVQVCMLLLLTEADGRGMKG